MRYLSFIKRKRKESPAYSACRNCETQLMARYCHKCGQDSYAGSERTVGEILYNTMDTVFAWDNKIFNTLKYLVFYPGKLTKDFFNGKVVQYVYPAKMFWFITVLFFAVINLSDKIDDGLSDDNDIETNVDFNTSQETIAGSIQQDARDKKMEKEVTDSSVGKKRTNKAPHEKVELKFKQDFVSYVPYIMFLLIPFFAFLLFILFYKKKKYYASHMIFALHFHSFVFLLLTILIFIKDYTPDSWEKTIWIIMFFLPVLYFAIALYVAYRPSIPKLLWKIPLVMFVYGIACCTVLVLFVLLLAKMAETTHDVAIL